MYQSITKLNNHELKEANKNKNINYNKILSNDRKRTLTLGNHLINSHQANFLINGRVGNLDDYNKVRSSIINNKFSF